MNIDALLATLGQPAVQCNKSGPGVSQGSESDFSHAFQELVNRLASLNQQMVTVPQLDTTGQIGRAGLLDLLANLSANDVSALDLNDGEAQTSVPQTGLGVSLTEAMAALQPLLSQSAAGAGVCESVAIPVGDSQATEDDMDTSGLCLAEAVAGVAAAVQNSGSNANVVPVTPQAQTGDSLPVEAPKGTNPATPAVDIAGQHETALPGQTQARQASPNVVETQPAAGGVTDQAGQRVTPETGFDARPALTPAAGDEPAPAPEALNVKASGRPDPMAGRIDSPVTASQTDAQPAESPGQPIVTGALQASQPQVGTTNVVVQSSATPQVPDVPALHQVVETVNLIDRRDGSQVRLRLHPEALGELVIRLAVSGNDVSVHMMAETSQARALIQEHLPQLKAAFVAQGFQADGLSVAVGGDTSAFDASAQQQGDWYQGSDAAPVPVLPDETAAEVEQRPLPETWQGSHAVDYHV